MTDLIDFNKCQAQASTTRIPAGDKPILYTTLGLAGEAGELANKVKKLIRDGETAELIEGIKGEMGDVLWYLSAMCDDLGVTLGDIAQCNLDKLQSCKARGQIKGGGDNR